MTCLHHRSFIVKLNLRYFLNSVIQVIYSVSTDSWKAAVHTTNAARGSPILLLNSQQVSPAPFKPYVISKEE